MHLKFKIFLLTVIFLNFAVAVSSNEVSENINDLVKTITTVNHDLSKKQLKQHNLDNAINDSGIAISKSEQLLDQLHDRQILDKKQLASIAAVIPTVTNNTKEAEDNLAILMRKVYIQIKALQNSSDSIISGNDEIDSKRKKMYLLKLLNQENSKYNTLQKQLKQLTILNDKLSKEIKSIDARLNNITQQKEQLAVNLATKKTEAQILKGQIVQEKHQLSGLRQKQAQLNRLLAELNAQEHDANKANNVDDGYEDNSPFLSRKLSRPVSGDVLMPFGAMKNNTKNHGVLFKADDIPVYAISNGAVIYSGNLPGFGQILVINHGDNYVSIYGGILPKVSKGDKVSRGEIIANSGSNANQPMGGVYFELRHLGRPVNPNSLL